MCFEAFRSVKAITFLQEKPPPVTSAKSTKLENLKRYQQQVFQNRQGSTPSQSVSVANPAYPVTKPVYTSSNPVYAGQLVTKSSLYGRPSGPTGFATQYETEFVRSKPVFVARDRISSGGYSSAQHFYREEPSPDEVKTYTKFLQNEMSERFAFLQYLKILSRSYRTYFI